MKTYTAEEAGRLIYKQLMAEGRENVIDMIIELGNAKRLYDQVKAGTWKPPAGELISISPYLEKAAVNKQTEASTGRG